VPSEVGIVVFGDVAASRRDSPRSSAWLRRLTGELDDATVEHRLARFGFTQGDELQGLLDRDADPFAVVLRAALADGALTMRWAIAAGAIDRGRGPATQRTGPAFLVAREALAEARRQRGGIAVRSGDPDADSLLAGAAPALTVLLGELTDRQRLVARLLIVDQLRQVEAAQRLGIARPTVSVMAERAHVQEIEGLAGSLRSILWRGIDRWADERDGGRR
jgi:hypothetical protein